MRPIAIALRAKPQLNHQLEAFTARAEERQMFNDPEIPGPPPGIASSGHLGPFDIQKIGADYYVTIGNHIEEADEHLFDPELWEPINLSTYFTAVEMVAAR